MLNKAEEFIQGRKLELKELITNTPNPYPYTDFLTKKQLAFVIGIDTSTLDQYIDSEEVLTTGAGKGTVYIHIDTASQIIDYYYSKKKNRKTKIK